MPNAPDALQLIISWRVLKLQLIIAALAQTIRFHRLAESTEIMVTLSRGCSCGWTVRAD